MSKTMRIMLIMLVCASLLAATAWGANYFAKVGDFEITSSEVQDSIKAAEFAKGQGAEIDVPTVEESVQAYVIAELTRLEFEARGIELTAEEQAYVDSYLNEQLAIIDEMVLRGGSERESAEAVLQTMKDYMEALGISEEEYAELVRESLIYTLKWGKLAEAMGGEAKLEAYLESAYEAQMAD